MDPGNPERIEAHGSGVVQDLCALSTLNIKLNWNYAPSRPRLGE